MASSPMLAGVGGQDWAELFLGTLMFRTAALRTTFLAAFSLFLLASFGVAAPCSLRTSNPSVTICSPAANALVTSSLTIVAGSTDSKGAVAMAIYVDNALVQKANGGQITASSNFAPGKH